MKKFIAISAAFLLLTLVVRPVFADETVCETTTGSYGQTSVACKTTVESTQTTQITHVETVDAGLSDINFWVLAQILFMTSIVLFAASKAAQRIYWFD